MRLLKSALRIVAAVVLVVGAALFAGCWAFTQPGIATRVLTAGPRAEPASLHRHVAYLTHDVFPRDFRRPDNLDAAAAYIERTLEACSGRVEEQVYETEGRTFRNVVARFGPEGAPVFVVGAHYDAFGAFAGADDNASGTAGLMELARILGARAISRPIVLVAYSTEEPPFFGGAGMGSAVHAKSLREAATSVRGMISLEMIGYFNDTPSHAPFLLRLFYPSRGDFVLVAGRYADRKLVREVMAGLRGEGHLVRVRGYTGPTGVGTDLSDHRNYWADGIPAVMVTDTAFVRNRNYHTAGDTADTLDYDRMAEVVNGVAAFLVAGE